MISKNLTRGYQNCITNEMLIVGGYVKVKKSLHSIIRVDTILN